MQGPQMGDREVKEVGRNAVQVESGQHKEISSLQGRGVISGVGYGDGEVLKNWSGRDESSKGPGQVRHGKVESQRLHPKEHGIRKNLFLT